MRPRALKRWIVALALSPWTLAIAYAHAQTSPALSHAVIFHIRLAPTIGAPVSGRLLVFLKQGKGDTEVDTEEFHPQATYVAAREVHDLIPGASVDLDADEVAYPAAYSTLKAGDYELQAVLDVNHTYAYSGRGPSDWLSAVVPMADWTPGSSEPLLTLDHHPQESDRYAAALKAANDAATPDVAVHEAFPSTLLTQFWGRPISIGAWVILPPGYTASGHETYPTAYWAAGFGGNLEYALISGVAMHRKMAAGSMPPMFWVMLDESVPQGTHEFADSINNGPWGTALTTEFIPALEKKYHMDAKSNGRFLNGHSSGGWASLQLQVNYPAVFGGTWSTSPDPSDFHDFTGTDLYAPHANVYHRPDGTPTPIMRNQGKVIANFEQFVHLEDVLGSYGGQVASFDWVFSPKSASGPPEPMFDHVTGDVHPEVVAYWHDHYDLAHVVELHWVQDGPMLKARIHLFVGTADTFYLDGAAHKFEARLQALGAEPHFTYVPDRTHFDLYRVDQDREGLFNQIGAEMYAVARPDAHWKAQTEK